MPRTGLVAGCRRLHHEVMRLELSDDLIGALIELAGMLRNAGLDDTAARLETARNVRPG
jgi:hypothetical protein